MKSPSFAVAIALALVAIGLTGPARADTLESPPPAPPEHSTPLALRPAKPLVLAQEPAPSGLGWKVVALLAVVGGVAFYFRKRVPGGGSKRQGDLLIVRRAAVGLRSELLVVNVEGQRLLIGVTPHTIQSLAVLDAEEAPAQEVSGTADTVLGERFAAMLDSARRGQGGTPRVSSAPRSRAPDPAIEGGEEVADQARGLLALRRGA